jgi:hypothetical protein
MIETVCYHKGFFCPTRSLLDFEARPEFTGDGRPLKIAEQESCPHRRPRAPGDSFPGDCGGCFRLYREQTPYDPIGICMCDALRRGPKSEEEEMK